MPHFGFTLSQRILKLGLKIITFLNVAFPGLFQNVFTFIPRLPEAQDNTEHILLGFFLPTIRYKYFLQIFDFCIFYSCYTLFLLRSHLLLQTPPYIEWKRFLKMYNFNKNGFTTHFTLDHLDLSARVYGP